MTTKTKTAKAAKKTTKITKPKPPTKTKGWRGIVAGTKKEQVARLFDDKGRDVALAKGLKLGLTEGTLRAWTGTWKRADKAKGKAKKEAA